MASSRMMRSSRLASPLDTATRDNVSLKREAQKPRDKQTSLGDWMEPPLRTPAPSFEDYKGLERQGVLEHMAPLGSFPNHKVKQRLKIHNGPRRSTHLKNVILDEEGATPEPTAPPVSRRSEPRKSEPRTSNVSTSREKDEDRDYTPPTAPKPAAAKGASTLIPPPIVNSRSSAQRLRSIVEAAVRRAEELKNPYLGKALQEVYNRSLHDRTMAELLDAVLAQKPTDKQTADFQAMVKQTRKEIKDADKGVLRQSSKTPGSNSKSSLKSPTKSDGGSAAHRGVNTEELSDAPGNQNNSPQSSKQRAKRMDTNYTPSKAERPTKRMKRTYSNASSTSSLSSITSDHFQRSPRRPYSGDISANNAPPPLPPQEYRHLGLGHGPKLHSFPLSRSKSSNKPPATSAAPNAEVPADELVAKRRQLQKSFEYTVSDSAVRDPPTVKPPPQRRKSHQIGSPLPLRTQQTRLRNGVTRHDLVDDHDLPSSGSSYNGELLAPPSADGHMVTRGATPNQLGRPPKHVKKGARIKMSPQKAKPTIAGQPRPGGDGDGDGLSDNASELDNDDICSACGGEGEVLCCDGCTRSFHYICLDPPKHGAPQGEWLCRHCIATRLKPQGFESENNIDGVTDGILGPVFKKLHGKNPHCFSLPKSVREAFEGVRTAASGEYEDVAPLKSKTRANPDMQLELAKAKEIMKDSVALCFACGGSNAGGREMIPCSFCTLHWHLDCLNPPLATSPFRENPNKPYAKDHAKLTWQCPNHADSEMQTLNEPAVTRRGTIRSAGGKVRKIRRPRHATIKDVGLRRGYVNNGIIEILNDPSDEENDFDTETGVVPRLPEKGIKLDFIDRVKSSALGTSQSVAERDVKKLRIAAATQAHKRQAAKAEMEALRRHSFAEQQVALALSQLQTPSAPVPVGISSVDTLIGTLISEAPQDVAELFERAEVVTDDQAEFLRLAVARMQEILAKKQQ